jgi:hypothetical protein
VAAVRKRGGRIERVAEKGPAAPAPAAPPTPMPEPTWAQGGGTSTIGREKPDPEFRVFVVRSKLLEVLEADRRDHDRLMQRAKEKKHHDEADCARAVVAYLDGLLARVRSADV